MSAREIAIEELSKLDVDASAAMVDATLYSIHRQLEIESIRATIEASEKDIAEGRYKTQTQLEQELEERWK